MYLVARYGLRLTVDVAIDESEDMIQEGPSAGLALVLRCADLGFRGRRHGLAASETVA